MNLDALWYGPFADRDAMGAGLGDCAPSTDPAFRVVVDRTSWRPLGMDAPRTGQLDEGEAVIVALIEVPPRKRCRAGRRAGSLQPGIVRARTRQPDARQRAPDAGAERLERHTFLGSEAVARERVDAAAACTVLHVDSYSCPRRDGKGSALAARMVIRLDLPLIRVATMSAETGRCAHAALSRPAVEVPCTWRLKRLLYAFVLHYLAAKIGGMETHLSGVLARLEGAFQGEYLSLGEVIRIMGERAFGPLLFLPALVILLPTGAVPGVPSLCALIITLVALQMLAGRRYPRLPGWLERRTIARTTFDRVCRTGGPALRWLDRWFHPRLEVMVSKVGRHVIAATVIVLAMAMVPMEFIPFAALGPASVIAVLGMGLCARDGLIIAAALAGSGGLLTAAFIVLMPS